MTTTTTISRTAIPAGVYTVDPTHSSIEFRVKHLGITNVRGHFDAFEGRLEVSEDLGSLRASGTVDVASIDTNEPQRDAHLRSPDFFDAEHHPKIVFESKAITRVDEDTFEVRGDLTLRGVRREVALIAELTGTENDLYGNERVGLEVTGELRRSDWGMTFNQALGSGNVLASDKVKLALDISAVKQA